MRAAQQMMVNQEIAYLEMVRAQGNVAPVTSLRGPMPMMTLRGLGGPPVSNITSLLPEQVSQRHQGGVFIRGLGDASDPPSWVYPVWYGLSAVSCAASAYHGYKRNRGSVGWALAWGALGGLFPVITPAIAVAEGYGKPAKR